jgi:membrane protease YdiL (CAAX protease family)
MWNGLLNTLLVVAGLFVYLSLWLQVPGRIERAGEIAQNRFGLPEAIAALLLIGWFVLNIVAATRLEPAVLQTRELILTGVVSLSVVLGLSVMLFLRGFNVVWLGGFSRLGFGRIVSTAAVLLLAAYPLLFAADLVSRLFLGEGAGRQQIIEMFTGSETLQQRILIIVLAVTVAPFAEEFIFRFFLFGVLKRYLGRGLGLLLNALLFGAVHVHLPSLLPLFVLGACFTLAYEWTGSILVSMTMHALFNFLSLSALAFPNLIPQ